MVLKFNSVPFCQTRLVLHNVPHAFNLAAPLALCPECDSTSSSWEKVAEFSLPQHLSFSIC